MDLIITPNDTIDISIKENTSIVYNNATFNEYIDLYPNFTEVENPRQILDELRPLEINGEKYISFDTETHFHFSNSHELPQEYCRRFIYDPEIKDDRPQDFPFSIQISDGTNCFAIYDTIENDFKKFRELSILFEDGSINKIAHNIKFDMHMLHNAGIKFVGKPHDTAVILKLIDENMLSYRLKDLSEKFENGISEFEYMVDAYKKSKRVTDYRQIPRELLTMYGCADVWNCMEVFKYSYAKILEENLLNLYEQELEDTVVLYAMERKGMKIDAKQEIPLKEELEAIADKYESEIFKKAGYEININSSAQLAKFFESAGLNTEGMKRTATGKLQLDKNAMASLERKQFEPATLVLEYRKSSKLLNTYHKNFYGNRDSNFRIHASINQTIARTGRMSITNPALQTLPKKDKRIRGTVIPEDDYILAFLDLDQIEYRLFAHYAKIEGLLRQIALGYDVHTATASMLYDIPIDELVTRMEAEDKEALEMRGNAKTINFALVYGVGVKHLSELMDCPIQEAKAFKAKYFRNLPEAKVFLGQVEMALRQKGYIKNFYGRRRRLPVRMSYIAANSLLQGCAADYVKEKIILLHKYIAYNNLNTRLINVVHDEVILEVHKSELEHLPTFRYLMSDNDKFRCPITAGLELSEVSWGSKYVPKEYGGFVEPEDKGYLDFNIFNGDVFNNNFYKGDSYVAS